VKLKPIILVFLIQFLGQLLHAQQFAGSGGKITDLKNIGIIYYLTHSQTTPIPTERRSPFPLEGKGLYTLDRKVLPFKGKDLGWGASNSR
jgi:hypothetical protein